MQAHRDAQLRRSVSLGFAWANGCLPAGGMLQGQSQGGRMLELMKWDDIEKEKLSETISRQMVWGEKVMAARVFLDKGAVVPRHAHHNEQLTMIFSGALKLIFDDREVTVRAGEMVLIPGNVPHAALALEDTLDMDVFSPPREDWIKKDDAYLRK
jgi:quercetin dioxygenase-like cupin family protein